MKDVVKIVDDQIENNKEVISLMPKKGVKKIREYKLKLQELIDGYSKINESLVKEIKLRYDKIINIQENPKLAELESELTELQNFSYESNLKTTFEKMNLDKLIYDINGYYKKDLKTTNQNILDCIKSFKEAGIEITSEDFNISEYVNEYITVLLQENNANSERVRKKFEDIYWKCSELIYHIYVNIRYLYDQNEKKLEKFYTLRTNEINEQLQSKYKDLKEKRTLLLEEYETLKNRDAKNILIRFQNLTLSINDYQESNFNDIYTKMLKNYEKLGENEKEAANRNIVKLNSNLLEYKKYLEYKFINDEIISMKDEIDKQKQNETEKQKDNKKKRTKTKPQSEIEKEKINKLYSEIIKLNNEILNKNKNKIFFKALSSMELKNKILQRDNKIMEIKKTYAVLDEIEFKNRIENNIYGFSKISEVLAFGSYNYGVLAKILIKNNNEITDKEIATKIMEIRNFIKQYNFSVINNINIEDKKDIAIIIKDKYELTGLNVTKDDFQEDNLDDLIRRTEIIKNYLDIQKSAINTDEIKFVLNAKEVLEQA
mgnify:CR=1 FL=1